jgi:hypothetical protein
MTNLAINTKLVFLNTISRTPKLKITLLQFHKEHTTINHHDPQ